jgi:hypothetical protein
VTFDAEDDSDGSGVDAATLTSRSSDHRDRRQLVNGEAYDIAGNRAPTR